MSIKNNLDIEVSTIFKNALDDDCDEYVSRYVDSSDDATPNPNLPQPDPAADFNAGVRATLERVMEYLQGEEAQKISLRKIGYIATDDAPNWAHFIRDISKEVLPNRDLE
jgi:hypothetical protein